MEIDTVTVGVVLGMIVLIMIGINMIIKGAKVLSQRNQSTGEVIGNYSITCEDGALTNAIIEFPDGIKIPMGAKFEIEIRSNK